eukprot:CAMPEP_0114997838 /NCGR_PEP_ID=MMETSP0216-20121206/15136_1 /TAXON_ID=223996 /ORGANISM="Protocruzia adherens, Strain Boccale" /LENGTH=262 /DNA_ID=CAMNT_0002362293 /DNA_START=57 /DNA_END=842 /DNA_ORIENTATION=+
MQSNKIWSNFQGFGETQILFESIIPTIPGSWENEDFFKSANVIVADPLVLEGNIVEKREPQEDFDSCKIMSTDDALFFSEQSTEAGSLGMCDRQHSWGVNEEDTDDEPDQWNKSEWANATLVTQIDSTLPEIRIKEENTGKQAFLTKVSNSQSAKKKYHPLSKEEKQQIWELHSQGINSQKLSHLFKKSSKDIKRIVRSRFAIKKVPGRKVQQPEMDRILITWIENMKNSGIWQTISNKGAAIQNKALTLSQNCQFRASKGW